MIVEKRVYTIKAGHVGDFIRTYKDEGLDLQAKALGHLIGYFTTEIGELNQVVHLWGYDNLQERSDRRSALSANPEWQKVLKKLLSHIERLENSILIPTDFSPIR